MNYHNKKFKVVSNSNNGEVTDQMFFLYQQEGNILSCAYKGSKIKRGQLIGKVDIDGKIDMRYQQVNSNDVLMTGICLSTPEILPNGKIRLHEVWQWTSGDLSKGTSILEEI